MITLTTASIAARKFIRFSIYALILIVIVRFAYNAGIGIYARLFPKPPPAPTVTFGKLPKLPFPDLDDNKSKSLSYVLETVDGTLPEFPIQLNAYFMPQSTSNIRVVEEARNKAQKLGFNPNGRELVETVYVFEKNNAPSNLTLNIVTNIFSISYDINANPSVVVGLPVGPETAIDNTTAFLSSGGFMKPDLYNAASTIFLKLNRGEFVEVSSLSEANLIKVNLYRKPIAIDKLEYPSVTPNYSEANVWFILSKSNTIIEGEYHYYPVDLAQSSTYPIKTANQAWEDLKAGRGYIANLGNNTETATIRNVYLGYYDAGQYTEYYQPVVVFEGDNGFAAYVPAVTSEYYPESNPTEVPPE